MNMVQDLFSSQVGLLSLFAVAFVIGMPIYILLFIRKEMLKDKKERHV